MLKLSAMEEGGDGRVRLLVLACFESLFPKGKRGRDKEKEGGRGRWKGEGGDGRVCETTIDACLSIRLPLSYI